MSRDKITPKQALKHALDSVNDELSKKRHLSEPEREAMNKLNGLEESAFFTGIIIGRLRAHGMTKAEVLYAISAVLKMEVS